jgi:thermostable 8-oxoguanine DNA glycosylase
MICKLCNQEAELRLGVCFDCASVQEIIGEQILKEPKPIKTNEIIKTLSAKGYLIVETKFVDEAKSRGIERDILR